jgi:hypothetical protein
MKHVIMQFSRSPCFICLRVKYSSQDRVLKCPHKMLPLYALKAYEWVASYIHGVLTSEVDDHFLA